MPIGYERTTYNKDTTPAISDVNLNNSEAGIEAACDAIDAMETLITTDEIVVNTATINNNAAVMGDLTITGTITGEVQANKISTPSYTSLQDIFNIIQSPGIITGGTVTDDGDGTITVAAGSGIIKSTDSTIGTNYLFDWAEKTDLSLTDNSHNFIYISYNSGSPVIAATVTPLTDLNRNFYLATVFKEGTTIDIVDTGSRLSSFFDKVQQHHFEEAQLHFVTGAKVSAIGTRNIAITSGVMYAGINRLTSDAVDTSGGDTFEYYYYNGSTWIESDQTQINNLQYNNVTTGLATLSNNKYGIHWVYKGTNNNCYVLYGQGDYTLAGATDAQPPGTLPSHVAYMGALRAKIIIQKGASSFTSVQNITDNNFTASAATNHNDLLGLQGGTTNEYYHLTAAAVTKLGTIESGADVTDATNVAAAGALMADGSVVATNDLDMGGNSISQVSVMSGEAVTVGSTNGAVTLTPYPGYNIEANGAIDLNTHKILGVVDPTSAQEAATKNYVDTGGWTSVPASASSTGTAGQKAYDSSYFYVCIATDTWVRASLSTW